MAQDPQAQKAEKTEIEPYRQLQKELAFIAGENKSFDIAAQVIATIMEAKTEDDIFAANAQGPTDIDEYLNRNLSVFGVTYFKSAEKFREGTLGFYVVIDAFTDDGEAIKISTGAPNVVSSLRKGETLGFIKEAKPWRVRINTKDTGAGKLFVLAKAA